MEKQNVRKVAPDGGYGWIACFGVSLVNVSICYFLFLFLFRTTFVIRKIPVFSVHFIRFETSFPIAQCLVLIAWENCNRIVYLWTHCIYQQVVSLLWNISIKLWHHQVSSCFHFTIVKKCVSICDEISKSNWAWSINNETTSLAQLNTNK